MTTWDSPEVEGRVIGALRTVQQQEQPVGVSAQGLAFAVGLPVMVVRRAVERLTECGTLRARTVGEQTVFVLRVLAPEPVAEVAAEAQPVRRWSGFTRPDSLRTKVVAVLQEAAGEPMWVDAVYRRVRERWPDELWVMESVRMALVALQREWPAEFERVEIGRYRYRTEVLA